MGRGVVAMFNKVARRGLAEGHLNKALQEVRELAQIDSWVKNILGKEDGKSCKARHAEGAEEAGAGGTVRLLGDV